jgi:Cu/Ag efflux pump CusA
MHKSNWTLVAGDSLALAIITVIGFASHRETNISFIPRMFTTFIPLVVSWFLIAPWLGLFDSQILANPKQLWRPLLAMLLAAPMTAVLRAAMLNAVALPLFTMILGGSAALGMLVWRTVWYQLYGKSLSK